MTSWISREEAFKVAKVTAFDAKRYLSIFYRFAPPDAITRGKKFSPLVPQILSNFKTMEMAGLTMALSWVMQWDQMRRNSTWV